MNTDKLLRLSSAHAGATTYKRCGFGPAGGARCQRSHSAAVSILSPTGMWSMLRF